MIKPSKKEHLKAFEAINIASTNLLLKSPFFGYLLLKQRFVAANWTKTLAVDGVNLYYNVNYVNNIKDKNLIQFILIHELLHLAYGHIKRFKLINAEKKYFELFNIACDIIVNIDAYYVMRKTDPNFIPPKGILIKEFQGYSSEAVYEILLSQIKEELEKEGKEATKENIEEKIKEMFPNERLDEHLEIGHDIIDNDDIKEDEDGFYYSDKKPKISNETMEKNLKTFKMNMEISKNGMNGIQNILPLAIKRILESNYKPTFPWKRYIKKVIKDLNQKKILWTKPNRRSFDSNFILPSKINKMSHKIYVSIDTSGSVSNKDVACFLGEIISASKQLQNVEIIIWSFDTDIYNVKHYKGKNLEKIKDYKVYGNGGTDFIVNWKFMLKKKIKPDLFFMFTDGGYIGEPGLRNYCDTIYVINKNNNFYLEDFERNNHFEILKKYGRVVFYDNK